MSSELRRRHSPHILRKELNNNNQACIPMIVHWRYQVIRQIIWKIVSFFGTFFKVQYLLIGNDL